MTQGERDEHLILPDQVGIENREEIRQAAEERLAAMPEGEGVLILDLSGTEYIDTAGLGLLAMVHRLAAERHHVVRLRNPNEEIRFSLVLARLDDLFELEPAAVD